MISALRYRIRLANPAAHLFEVSLTVDDPDPQGQVFSMPAWIPGSYMIRDYARNVVTIRAESDGRAVALEKLDKSRWQAASVDKPLTVIAEIFRVLAPGGRLFMADIILENHVTPEKVQLMGSWSG